MKINLFSITLHTATDRNKKWISNYRLQPLFIPIPNERPKNILVYGVRFSFQLNKHVFYVRVWQQRQTHDAIINKTSIGIRKNQLGQAPCFECIFFYCLTIMKITGKTFDLWMQLTQCVAHSFLIVCCVCGTLQIHHMLLNKIEHMLIAYSWFSWHQHIAKWKNLRAEMKEKILYHANKLQQIATTIV